MNRHTKTMVMDKFTVKLGISSLTSEALVTKGRNVHESILGNANFPTLQALLPALLTACEELEDANQAMEFHGGKVSANNKRTAERNLRSLLKDFGGYVQGISEGDKATILSAAFDTVKERSPLPPPEAPVDVRVTRTALAGNLKVQWKRRYGALLYYLEFMQESGEWKRILSTTRTRHELFDLITGTEYSFRVQTVSTSGISGYSEVVSQKAA